MLSCQALFVLAIKRAAWHWALSHRRTVWFSEEFLHVQTNMASFLVARMAAGPHQWTIVTDLETFAKRAPTKNKRAKTMPLGFVSNHQLLDEDLQSAKPLTLDVALSFLAVIDSSKTITGMCAK